MRWVAGALLLLTGCSAPALACTEIGSASGVSVTVLAPYADRGRRRYVSTVCWSGADCVEERGRADARQRHRRPGLQRYRPGRHLLGDRGAQRHPGRLPRRCPSCRPGPVTVERHGHRRAGEQRRLAEVTRTAETTYPNGPQCGAGGNQLAVAIDQAGLR